MSHKSVYYILQGAALIQGLDGVAVVLKISFDASEVLSMGVCALLSSNCNGFIFVYESIRSSS